MENNTHMKENINFYPKPLDMAIQMGQATITVGKPFDLDKKVDGKTILEVNILVNDELLEFFKKHPEEMKKMDRRKFEELTYEVFKKMGYTVELTKKTRDNGYDISAVKNDIFKVRYLISCKRPDPDNPVRIHAVREIHSVVEEQNATKGILVTTTWITPPAKKLIEKLQWRLEGKDFDDICDWLKKV